MIYTEQPGLDIKWLANLTRKKMNERPVETSLTAATLDNQADLI
jgi:hypothetical protein